MAATSLQKKLLAASDELAKRYGTYKATEKEDFIANLALQILALGNTERSSRDALKRIREEYVDWNDMRVATVRELQDILGPRFTRCREKAEDLHSLLADMYTAFRRMDVNEVIVTPDGIATLRALPDTTLIRGDMVETALLTVCGISTFPCDEAQFELLQFLGAIPKTWEFDTHLDKIVEALDVDQMLALSHGLREHVDFLQLQDIFDPKPVDFGQKPAAKKPAAKKAPAKKPAAKKTPAKKTSTDNASDDKPAAKKAPAKKTAAKKAPAKKPAAKKPAAE